MAVHLCPGLTGDWLSAWLAAIGITVLIPDAKLSWTADRPPTAVIDTDNPRPLAEQIADLLPTPDQWWDRNPAIAPDPSQKKNTTRSMTPEEYRQRAELERRAQTKTLAASLTDLAGRPLDQSHSPFDPAAPGSTGGVFHRVLDCLTAIPQGGNHRAEWIQTTLDGPGRRIAANGLGFDIRRITSGSLTDDAKKVDPVIEALAHTGLDHFPVRGDGAAEHTRGWMGRRTTAGALAWPCWTEPLNRWAIDALIDQFTQQRHISGDDTATMRTQTRTLGITHAFTVVPYKPKSSADATRGYGSQPWW